MGETLDFGTNADGSKSTEYCNFCYQNGKFTDEGITMEQKIVNVAGFLAKQGNVPQAEAIATAKATVPTLKRWKGN